MWYIYTMEYDSAVRKNGLMAFAATWMGLEILLLRMSARERHTTYDITYMWKLKTDTNELIYKTEMDSQTKKTNFMVIKGEGREGCIEVGIKIHTRLCAKQISNRDLPYSTGNDTQYFAIT